MTADHAPGLSAPVMSDMERLARDLCHQQGGVWDFIREPRRDVYRRMAQAALRSDWLRDHGAALRADLDAARARLGEVAEALEACREQRADLLELVEIERAVRSDVAEEIDAAYRVGANYVPCRRLRTILDGAARDGARGEG